MSIEKLKEINSYLLTDGKSPYFNKHETSTNSYFVKLITSKKFYIKRYNSYFNIFTKYQMNLD